MILNPEHQAVKVIDPVCQDELALDDDLPRAEYRGWVYFFCSGDCHDRFLDDPDRHAVAPAPGAAG